MTHVIGSGWFRVPYMPDCSLKSQDANLLTPDKVEN